MTKPQKGRLALNSNAFTVLEMAATILVIAILAAVAIISFSYYTKQAYNIITKHDLQKFIQAEKAYFAANSKYLGVAGDFIEGNPPVGPLAQAGFNFIPENGVRITIKADGSQPGASLKIEANHRLGDKIITYNFGSGEITERE